MNKKYKVTLTKVEKEVLEGIISKGKYRAPKLKRAYILLGADESKDGQKMIDEQISQAYRVRVRTVEKLRKRFVEEDFEVALHGNVRKLRSDIKIDGDVQAHVIAISRSSPPKGRKRWTLQLISEQALKYYGLETHRLKTVAKAI